MLYWLFVSVCACVTQLLLHERFRNRRLINLRNLSIFSSNIAGSTSDGSKSLIWTLITFDLSYKIQRMQLMVVMNPSLASLRKRSKNWKNL
ncbi:hypothetical protein K1719_037893 [Acacia pycnantha]|nr:hypothetical protein K1719_037893 [Acacia pycnantha]